MPTVLVTSQNKEDNKPNIITIAWTGILASGPQLVVYISVRPKGRYSHQLITQSLEYVINIPTADQAQIVDYCGQVSGKDVDKFQVTGLTPIEACHVKVPLIAECPVNLECRVRQIVCLGTHDVFIADVLTVHYNNEVLDDHGKPDLDKIKPISFCSNEYRPLSNQIGTFGYSLKVKK
ncbi:flavin reductase family protein [Desulfosporosinus burensis]